MQKTKPNAAASKAKAHNSGKAGKYGKAGGQGSQDRAGSSGKARKPLTPEQRERKRLADKARRRRIKLARQETQARQAKHDSSRCSRGCACGRNPQNAKNGKAGSQVTATDIAVMIGKHIGTQVAGQIAEQIARSLPGHDVVGMSKLVDVEPGVARGTVAFSNGARAVFTFVDRDELDPLSEYSPLPAPVKDALLRLRIAQEVSDLVDAHIGLESEL